MRPANVVRALAQLALVLFAAYAASQVFALTSTDRLNFVLWLLVGAILHDAVLLPAYALTDLLARVVLAENALRRVPLVNHVRFPIVFSGVLLLVYLPSILGRGDGNFRRVSGKLPAVEPLEAWLWITAAAVVLSAVVYLVRFASRGRTLARDLQRSRPSSRPTQAERSAGREP